MSAEAKCKGCGRGILWASHAMSGRMMPFDREPHESGTWHLMVLDTATGRAGKGELTAVHDPQAEPRYVPHHATCPAVDQFRKPKPRHDGER